MKKIIIIVSIVAFIFALIAINVFLGAKRDKQIEAKDNQEESKIIQVTSQNFEEVVLKSEKIVLVDFYATWCGPCKILSPIIEEIAKENENVKFVKIDIDKEEQIAMEYQVMSIPTLVLIQEGKEVNRIIGLADKYQILDFIEGK